MMPYLNNPQSTIKKRLELDNLSFTYSINVLVSMSGGATVSNIFSNRKWVHEAYVHSHSLTLLGTKLEAKYMLLENIKIGSYKVDDKYIHIDLYGQNVNLTLIKKPKPEKEKVVFT